MSWLPDGFEHPTRLDLPSGHHVRPIRETDVDLDYPAVMGSRERLWSMYGDAWGWPPATMTYEEDRADLARHEGENVRHKSFCYAVFDEGERELVGCVYVDPPEDPEDAAPTPDTTDAPTAIVSWWVIEKEVGRPLEAALDDGIPRWLDSEWPFGAVRYGV